METIKSLIKKIDQYISLKGAGISLLAVSILLILIEYIWDDSVSGLLDMHLVIFAAIFLAMVITILILMKYIRRSIRINQIRDRNVRRLRGKALEAEGPDERSETVKVLVKALPPILLVFTIILLALIAVETIWEGSVSYYVNLNVVIVSTIVTEAIGIAAVLILIYKPRFNIRRPAALKPADTTSEPGAKEEKAAPVIRAERAAAGLSTPDVAPAETMAGHGRRRWTGRVARVAPMALFLIFLSLLILQSGFNLVLPEGNRTGLLAATIVSGLFVFWMYRDKARITTTAEETDREEEHEPRFPRMNNIPVIKLFTNWIYKGESWYSIAVIMIFCTGVVLNILAANWSGGYAMHSGENQFYVLIKAFSDGDFGAIYNRTQSIVIYTLGSIDYVFDGNLSIFSLRLIISLPCFVVNFYILTNLRTVRALSLSRLSAIYILIGFTFSYTILFWGNVIRSDIILLTLFNLFIYEYLRNGTRNLLYLIILSAITMSFKGSGLLMPVTLLALVNFENIKPVFLRQHWNYGSFLFNNFFVILLTYLLFLLLSPTYLNEGLLSFFSVFNTGIETFNTGFFGYFATGQPLISAYAERFINFIIFFSPIIVFYFVGTLISLYKNCRTLNLRTILGSPNIRALLIIVLSIIFLLFIFTKPLQFYRYYFPLLTVFIVISFMVVSRIKPKIISIALVVVFLVFNSYFIHHYVLSNIRLQMDFSSFSPIYRDTEARWFNFPPNMDFKGSVRSTDELPSGSYLIITEHVKYKYENIKANPEYYPIGILNEVEREELEKGIQFYDQLSELTLVMITGKDNRMFGHYLPYDVWYMTQPNYYIYYKD